MNMDTADGRSRLYRLLAMRVGEETSFADFCREFEQVFNFEVRRGDLSPEEEKTFTEVFDTVVWYSSVASERAELPTHFKDEASVATAISKARGQLGIELKD